MENRLLIPFIKEDLNTRAINPLYIHRQNLRERGLPESTSMAESKAKPKEAELLKRDISIVNIVVFDIS